MNHASIHPLVTAAALFLWMSCHAAARQGRPFFIDPGSGSDLADGLTEQTPWKSAERLQRSPLVPGDRVLFRAGTKHRGTVSISGAGDGKTPVLIGRYGDGEAPVIDGMGASNAFVITHAGERRLIRAGNWLGPDWPEGVRWRHNLFVTAGTLYSEIGDSTDFEFDRNLWSGGFRVTPRDLQPVYGDPGFLASPGSSLNTAVRRGSAAVDAGFKPFDLSKSGLPPGSPWREHARSARGL